MKPMRIFFLADGGSPHVIKWARSLADSGAEIFIFGLHYFDPNLYSDYPLIHTHSFQDKGPASKNVGCWSKMNYLFALKAVRQKLREFKPDILHAHYASSYGLLGALSGFRPYFISVWGADVYDFPTKSFIHKLLIKYNLRKAKAIFSTSHVMALQAQKFTDKPISVIPFGVDISKFHQVETQGAPLTLGTIKALEDKYGISYLLESFYLLKRDYSCTDIKLVIVGSGSKEEELKSLAHSLGIMEDTLFVGQVAVEEVPKYHQSLDITVFPSVLDSESFGVSVIEASSCGKPVVVTRKGGLVEVVDEDITGLIVPAHDSKALAGAMYRLINDKALRERMGSAGRKKVEDNYEWKHNFQLMMDEYSKEISTSLAKR